MIRNTCRDYKANSEGEESGKGKDNIENGEQYCNGCDRVSERR